MYNLLKSIQQKTHQPNAFAENISILDPRCEEVQKLQGNWIYCKRPCDKTCGDGKKVWEVICPRGNICSSKPPVVGYKAAEYCVGNQCPWTGQILPSVTTFYNTKNQVSDCGSGTQKIKTVCSYKLDDKYCERGNCNFLGRCSKPPDGSRTTTQFNGCQFSKIGIPSKCDKNCLQTKTYICQDSKGNGADPKACVMKFGRGEKTEVGVCRGGDCPKK